MIKQFILLSGFLMLLFSCAPNNTHEQLYHRAELQHDIWKDDSTAIGQVYSISTDTSTTISCEQGTRIVIPEKAFVWTEKPSEPVQGVVELRIVEVYRKGDMFRHYLSTQETAGALLESTGMIHISAMAQGKEVQLGEGKSVLIGFPKKEEFEDSLLFSGVQSMAEPVKWQQAPGDFDLKQAIIDTYFGGDNSLAIKIILNRQEKIKEDRQALEDAGANAGIFTQVDTAVNEAARFPIVMIEDELYTGRLGLTENYNEFRFFSSDKLGWITCDRFVQAEELTDLQLQAKGYPNNTLYYLLFEGMNALMVGHASGELAAEAQTIFRNVPVGSRASVIIVYYREGNYFLAAAPITIGKDKPLRLQAVKKQKEEIRAFLQGLGSPTGIAAR